MCVLIPFIFLIAFANSCAVSEADKETETEKLSTHEDDVIFKEFMTKHNKQYKDVNELKHRRKIFHDNLKIIKELEQHDPHVKFEINFMSDWTEEERQKLYGLKGVQIKESNSTLLKRCFVPDDPVPEEWDWRTKNIVSEVKAQGHCGSCYIFSAIGNIESMHAKKHGKLVSLSEQQVLDCGHNDGCVGGLPDQVMNDLARMGGSEPEKDYPYTGKKHNECTEKKEKIVVKVTGGARLNLEDEESLKKAVYNIGPLSIGMLFRGADMAHYGKGVLIPTECLPGIEPDHAVLLVGYGTDEETKRPYWLIKNSWGTHWGEGGYLRVIRGQKVCGLLSYVAWATVA